MHHTSYHFSVKDGKTLHSKYTVEGKLNSCLDYVFFSPILHTCHGGRMMGGSNKTNKQTAKAKKQKTIVYFKNITSTHYLYIWKSHRVTNPQGSVVTGGGLIDWKHKMCLKSHLQCHSGSTVQLCAPRVTIKFVSVCWRHRPVTAKLKLSWQTDPTDRYCCSNLTAMTGRLWRGEKCYMLSGCHALGCTRADDSHLST